MVSIGSRIAFDKTENRNEIFVMKKKRWLFVCHKRLPAVRVVRPSCLKYFVRLLGISVHYEKSHDVLEQEHF